MIVLKKIVTGFTILLLTFAATAAPFENLPMMLTQPDGTVINCFASGDEFHNWLHDENGYTIMQHPVTGFYVYAQQDGERIKPTDFIAERTNPASVGLEPNANISSEIIYKKRIDFEKTLEIPAEQKSGELNTPYVTRNTKSSSLSNIVIFVQFSNENITNELISFYENIYSKESGPSLKHYYNEVTNNKLTLNTTLIPKTNTSYVVWYTDSNPRNYYQPYNAATNTSGYDPDASSGSTSRVYREHMLLKSAIEATRDQIPSDFNVDANGDNFVDCVSFIISGGPDGWSDLLWPHRWSLYSQYVTISNKRVWDYTFQMQNTSSGTPMRLGTVVHEMFHVIGAPDLYRYDNTNITPVGVWDIMASTTNNPQQMTAYMKYLYGGWIDEIPEITQTGNYQLNPLQSETNNCFKIPSPYTHAEYFMVEYRNASYTYDNTLPGSGLIIYRINDRQRGQGNASGPPDELYIYRPDGTNFVNGTVNSAFYSQSSGRTAINSTTSPSPFLTNGEQGGLSIENIGSAGSTISFKVNADYDAPRGISHYKASGRTSVGPGSSAQLFSVAAKFTPTDLANYTEKYLTKVEFYIRDGGGTNVTAKVWEGSTGNVPGTLVYQKSISSELVLNDWTLHTLDQSVKIKPNTDYWIGYEINATGGYPAATDRGPMVQGKGGWIKWTDTWQQITELNADLSYNFLIGGVVQTEAISSVSTDKLALGSLTQNFPNPFSRTTTINYVIDKASFVEIKVFNTLGQQVATIVSEKHGVGNYSVDFDAQHLADGVYLYQLTIDKGIGGTVTKRMVIGK